MIKKLIIILLSISILNGCSQENKKIPANIDLKNTIKEEKENLKNNKINGIKEILNNILKLKLNENDIEELFSQLDNFYKDKLIQTALNHNNLKICNKFEEEENINNCKKLIYEKNLNQIGCNKLKNNFLKQECLINIFKQEAINKYDENICNKIKNNIQEEFKDIALFEIQNCKNKIFKQKALNKHNIYLCNKIKNTILKEACKEEINNIGYIKK